MERITVTFAASLVAFAFARGVGIPIWIDWPTWDVPADATDIAFLVGLIAFNRAHQPKEGGHG